MSIQQNASWKTLTSLAESAKSTTLRSLLMDVSRLDFLRYDTAGVFVDFSRHNIDRDIFNALIALAKEQGAEDAIKRMFTGEIVNRTEKRAVLHTALRAPKGERILIEGKDVVSEVHAVLDQMSAFAKNVMEGKWRGYTGETITDIVAIGIGGSNLGPEMVYHALAAYRVSGIEVRFVANVDPCDLSQALEGLEPERTLFVISSKTFTTSETMANATAARDWLTEKLGKDAIPKHFIAVSTNAMEVEKFGISPENMFVFWDWVGGRFSVSSAIGLPLMLSIGPENFREFLVGMREMDEHYRTASCDKNLPLAMALVNIWNTNFLGYETHGIIAYAELLELFPLHLQQLIMESLGKGVREDGEKVDAVTCPIFYPGLGTNAQHAFFQLLHQGNIISPLDFITVLKPEKPELKKEQTTLVLNAIAQSRILAQGITDEELKNDGVSETLIPHKRLPGNRPSTFICLEQVTPHTLGALLAMYEHMVHAWGTIMGINAFDQYGVEGGKKIARSLQGQVSDSCTLNDVKRMLE